MANYLISTEKLKESGLIHKAADTKLLKVCIKRVQDRIIHPALGSPLYRALLTRVENDNWNATYRTLMDDYVIPALVACVDAKYSKVGTAKLTNKGTGMIDDDQFTALQINELNQFRDELDSDGFYYLERLIGFLKDDCGTDYPEYTEAITRTNHDVKKDSTGYKTNWIV